MTATLAHIFRHPIKAHGREELASVSLSAGQALPWDRHWAVAHAASHFDAEEPMWVSCANFQRAARTPALMAMTAAWDGARMRLAHPDLGEIDFDPETEAARFLDWIAPISPTDRFRPVALVRGPRAMTDSEFPSVSIKNLASNAALSAHMGVDLSIHRWRGNLWVDGLAPWAEVEWIGRDIRIGGAVLAVRERVGRCKATTANPDTGRVDADTLRALREVVGAQDFGVFAVVKTPGEIRPGDRVELL